MWVRTGLVVGSVDRPGRMESSLEAQEQGEGLGWQEKGCPWLRGWMRLSWMGVPRPLHLHAGSSFLIFIKIHLLSPNLTLCQVLYKETWSLPLRNFQPKTHTHCHFVCLILNINVFPTLFQRG